MFEKMDSVLLHYEEIARELAMPEVVQDMDRYRKLMREQTDLTQVVETYRAYQRAVQDVADSLEMIDAESDPEMKEMARDELADAKERVEKLTEEMKVLLLPKDPNDDKNVICEIRAGAGGDEAALFAAQIYRMYVHYAESRGWKTELLDFEESGIGGMKFVNFMIIGQGAYSRMKYESGVHRVQRVPATESQGRIHTSTITVAVMPEVTDDIKIDIFRQELSFIPRRSVLSFRIRTRPGHCFVPSCTIWRCRTVMTRRRICADRRSEPETAQRKSGRITSRSPVSRTTGSS